MNRQLTIAPSIRAFVEAPIDAQVKPSLLPMAGSVKREFFQADVLILGAVMAGACVTKKRKTLYPWLSCAEMLNLKIGKQQVVADNIDGAHSSSSIPEFWIPGRVAIQREIVDLKAIHRGVVIGVKNGTLVGRMPSFNQADYCSINARSEMVATRIGCRPRSIMSTGCFVNSGRIKKISVLAKASQNRINLAAELASKGSRAEPDPL